MSAIPLNRFPAAYGHNYALAQEALGRALQLNPDLPIAHNLYTYLEVELGQGEGAISRLLERAERRRHDPELFAGIVQACRYCGLLEESIAAFDHARRIDPWIRTSVAHAFLMNGEYQRAIETNLDDPPIVAILALELSGRTDEAIGVLRERETERLPSVLHDLIIATRTLIEGKLDECWPATERLVVSMKSRDPCSAYYKGRHLARLGDKERALATLRSVVEGGFFVPSFLSRDPWLDSLRGEAEFQRIFRLAQERHEKARRTFLAAGGDRIVGLAM